MNLTHSSTEIKGQHNRLPLEALDLLSSLIGEKIERVERQLLISDYEAIPRQQRDQEADGPVQMGLSRSIVVNFVPDAESMSLRLSEGPMRKWGNSYMALNVSENEFWKTRLDREIKKIEILQSKFADANYPSQFGIEIALAGADSLVIEYISDDFHVDALRVTGPYEGPPCLRIPVQLSKRVRVRSGQ